jgi:hypothetical protein
MRTEDGPVSTSQDRQRRSEIVIWALRQPSFSLLVPLKFLVLGGLFSLLADEEIFALVETTHLNPNSAFPAFFHDECKQTTQIKRITRHVGTLLLAFVMDESRTNACFINGLV